MSYASTGVCSEQHVAGEAFKLAAGVDLIHVSCKGFGPVAQAMLAQETDIAFAIVAVMRRKGRQCSEGPRRSIRMAGQALVDQ